MSTTENQIKKSSKKHKKDKPWDNPDIDHWKIDPIDPEQVNGPFLQESSFSVLFPQYREKYIQECHGIIKKKLMEFGVKFQLNLLEGSMTVRTTKKTWDPYIIIKARDAIKLISRSVPYQQALKVLEDGICCEVIKIRSFVRNKQRFIKRRQRLIGPNGDTLKALQLLTECYIMVQGSTVCVIGNFKNIKVIRRIIIDTMQNIHPVYHIKELMVKRQLMKDDTLKDQNWDRFLPKFKQIKISKKRRRITPKTGEKQYNPFPPEPTPRLEDIKMETGEYFLSEAQIKQRKLDIKKKKQEKLKREKELDARQKEENDQEEQLEVQKKKQEQRQKKRKEKKEGGSGESIQDLKKKFLKRDIKKITF